MVSNDLPLKWVNYNNKQQYSLVDNPEKILDKGHAKRSTKTTILGTKLVGWITDLTTFTMPPASNKLEKEVAANNGNGRNLRSFSFHTNLQFSILLLLFQPLLLGFL